MLSQTTTRISSTSPGSTSTNAGKRGRLFSADAVFYEQSEKYGFGLLCEIGEIDFLNRVAYIYIGIFVIGGIVMATSSLSKSFVIKTKTEAKNFVKLFTEQDKNPPLRDVNVIPVSKDRLKELINASRK